MRAVGQNQCVHRLLVQDWRVNLDNTIIDIVTIIVITSSAHVATQTSGYMKNCRATCVDSMIDTQAIIKGALAEATSSGLLKVGDTTVAIYGDKDGESGSTNTMHIVTV